MAEMALEHSKKCVFEHNTAAERSFPGKENNFPFLEGHFELFAELIYIYVQHPQNSPVVYNATITNGP